MTPVTRCLRKVDHASAVSDTTIVASVREALAELEASYHRPSDKIVALEAVLQQITRRHSATGTPIAGFIRSSVEQRQDDLARSSV